MPEHNYQQVTLVVLDGFGVAPAGRGNAISVANPGWLNHLVANFPSTTIQAAGPLVGLPWGEMGNSEVGHMNIGAGRIVGQDLPRITAAIQDKSFFHNSAFATAIKHVQTNHSRLHLLGLISSGGVHAFDEHMYALLGVAAEAGLEQVYIHMILDGRDTAPKVALDSLMKLRAKIRDIGLGQIATIAGRFYAMDRGKHWDQTESMYAAMVRGEGPTAHTAEDAVLDNYNAGIFDEMIPPTVITKVNEATGEPIPVATVQAGDAVIFSNFRSDRALQLTEAFVDRSRTDLPKYPLLDNLCFVTMSEYYFGLPVKVAFPSVDLKNNLAEVLSNTGYRQYHTAESEKYAHVTSFFSGGKSDPYPGEDRVIVNSPADNKNYELHPEMSGQALTDQLVQVIQSGQYQFCVANFANPDMVGHTGNLAAAIKAVQAIDHFLQQITQAVLQVNGLLIITADHGNVEEMIDGTTGDINKDHTTNPVPLIFVANDLAFPAGSQRNYQSLANVVPQGVISDIAPTILKFLGVAKPAEMTGVELQTTLSDFFTPPPAASTKS